MGYKQFNSVLGKYESIPALSTSNMSGYIVQFVVANSGHHVGSNWIAPRDGTINDIGVICTFVSGSTPPTYKLCIEALNTSKDANGTILAQTNGFIPSTASGFHWIPLSTPFAVGEGSGYACTVRLNSGTIDGANCAFFGYIYAPSSRDCGYISPFPIRNNGSFSTPNGFPTLTPRYSDNTLPKGFFPLSSGTVGYLGTTFNSGTTLPMKGLAFSTPFACKIDGFIVTTSQASANSHLEIRLYDYNNTLIFNRGYLGNRNYNAGQGAMLVEMASGIEIYPNRTYRVVINPTGTANVTQAFTEFTNANDLLNYYGPNMSGCMTEGSGSPPSWQNYNGEALGYRAYSIIPLISAIPVAGRRRAR